MNRVSAALCLSIASCSTSPALAPASVATSPPAASPLAPIAACRGTVLAERTDLLDDETPAVDDDAIVETDTTPLPSDGGVCDPRRHASLEKVILASAASRSTPTATTTASPAAPSRAWDRATPPAYHDLVAHAFSLSTADEAQLARAGFVVPARLGYDDYTSAYYDIHRAQLPIFITADSIFHAVFVTYDDMLATLERTHLIPMLDDALGKMACKLNEVAADYPSETVRDLDLYLTVARDLLGGDRDPVPGPKQALAIVKLVADAGSLTTIELFGRLRRFDPTMYTPRGHYVDDGDLTTYFRAAMWMSRVEMNLSSRDSQSSTPSLQPDPTETPREAVLALALADLADRSGALADLEVIDRGWGAFAGGREDVSLRELLALRAKAGITKLAIPDSATRLRAAIGDGYRRTVNVHPMPDVPNLPVVATAIGPRITADTVAFGRAQAAGATISPAAEMGFLLGHDRATSYLEPTISRPALVTARAQLAASKPTPDLYDTWLRAILALATPATGTHPAFMDGAAYADLRLDTAITAYGQLRHDNVLMAAQMYEGGGCEIPDGYVEPVPAVYDALATYAMRARQVFVELAPKDHALHAYFTRAERIFKVLAVIARDELAGRVLDDDEKHFLAQVVEQRVHWVMDYEASHPAPTYDGWYIDLLFDKAFQRASFVADFGTHVRQGAAWVDYIGAKGPRMGMFVVDVGGTPRIMAGPVAQGFGVILPLARRETDGSKLTGTAPWERSYAVAAPPEPDLAVSVNRETSIPNPDHDARPRHRAHPPDNAIFLRAKHAIGAVTIELRDHHFVKIGTLAATVGAGEIKLPLPPALRAKTESLVVAVGGFRGRVDISLAGWGGATFGAMAQGDP